MSRKGVCVRIGLLWLTWLLGASLAWGQNVGSLQGEVTDATHAVIVGATVKAIDIGSGVTRTTQTDNSGAYDFSQLRPGTYKVEVSMQGFRTFVQEQVTVLVSTPTHLDVELELGATTQVVEVQAEAAPALNTMDATVGNAFEEKQVKSLPFLARNVVNLLTLQPGVIFTGESDTDKLSMGTISGSLDEREGAVNGVRGNQTNITVDGVDSNDWQNQAAFTSALPLTLDSIQEFRVTTTSANATDGGAGGAQVALVTKGGSNAFHGNLRWYYRTSGTTANSFFNNAGGIGRPKLQRNIFGGSLGGPLIKDRVFFFVDDEERREASAVAISPRSVATDSLRDGVLIYTCGDPTQCPGGMVQGLTSSHVVPPGDQGLTPAQIQQLDPAGLGVNQGMISYMGLFPHGNDPSQGEDNGLNFSGFRFNAPVGTSNNIYTARFDFNISRDGRHTVFWRGILGGIKTDLTEAQFPGQSVAKTLLNNSRGFVAQYQAQLRPNLIDTFRWGFTRMGVTETGTLGAQFGVRDFTDLINYNRGSGRRVPVNELRDDLSQAHGDHALQFGGMVHFVRNKRVDYALSFPGFLVNDGFCFNLCRDAVNSLSGLGLPPASDPGIFTRAYMMLTGSITQVNASFLADPANKKFLPSGSPELRTFAENAFEVYGQDSWHARPNLTLTFGLRYGYETPPWETHGFQVRPNTDIMKWFQQRIANMNAGIPSSASPLLSWDLAGKANGKPSWFDPYYKAFAPRLALAYSPGFSSGLGKVLFGGAGKTSIRAGAGLYYNRIGQAIAVDSDLNGSPGTSTALINPSQTLTLADAPRFSGSCSTAGCSGLPPLTQFLTPPTTVSFPFTPPSNTSNLGFAVDPHLRTPYSINLTLSVQRELPRNVVVDVAYVGTLGRRLLGKIDYGQYLDIRDPKSGVDLWSAFRRVVNYAGQSNPFTPAIDPTNFQALSQIASIPFFDNMAPNMPAFTAAFTGNPAYNNVTPTQAFYAYAMQEAAPSWACPLFVMDIPTLTGLPSPWSSKLDPNGTGFVLYTPQWATLPGWTNLVSSHYHSLQISVRKNVGRGVFGFNYVLSKSIDNASSPENGDLVNGTLDGLIENPFFPNSNRGLSDFDLRHNISADWTVDLPFGRGARFGANAGSVLNGLIGGWEVTGLVRWRSGFPLSPGNGFNFPTNFFLTANGTFTAPVKSSLTRDGANGLPNLFRDRDAVLKLLAFTAPGLNGSRNVISSPAFADLDAGVYKSFKMPWSEKQRMQFRVTAFNALNSVNFSTTNISLDPTAPSTFGKISSTAGPRGGAREMEFAIRYEF